jgi:hypothetical protein
LNIQPAPKLPDTPVSAAGNSDLSVQVRRSEGISEVRMTVVKIPSFAVPVWCFMKKR